MSLSKVTMYGFYHWFEAKNENLFDFLLLPDTIDKNTVIENIMIKAGEFDLVYDSPDFMRESIRTWSAKWFNTFEKWATALNIKYDPLYNYDRYEEWDENATGHNDTTGNTTNTGKVSAYNSNEFENASQSINIGDSSADSRSNSKRVGRAYGNIGVTTSQQMLHSELDIASWNLVEHITDIFLNEYVIPIY